MNTIEFHGSADALLHFPHPYAANHAVPDWVRQIPMNRGEGDEKPTVKRCPPFLEALTAGYIIPFPLDCSFTIDSDGRLQIDFDRARYTAVSAHHRVQYEGTPFQNAAVVKFHNPWVIRTPAGYSTLFVQPFNRFGIPFVNLSGIVETDDYYREVHFPAICTMQRGTSFTIRAGTPMAQLVPIKREAWNSSTVQTDRELRLQAEAEIEKNSHAYKEKYWRKRDFA